jgi:DNA repair protein RecO (recombination protein O)
MNAEPIGAHTRFVALQCENRAMRLYRDRAVVLRQHKLGEADRIVTLLTRDHGLVRAVAKGVRRTRSKFGAKLEPFSHIDVQLHPGRNLDIVTQVVCLDAFAIGIVSDYGRYTSACAVLETAERLAGEEHAPVPDLHRLTVGALRAVADGARPRGLILDAYLLRAMGIAGWAPALTECARCATPGPHRAFHVGAGGSVCVHCRPAGSSTPPQAVLELMSALHDGDWDSAQASTSSQRSQASGLVAAHLQWHLERQLRTLPLVERIHRIDRTVADHRAWLVGQDVGDQHRGDRPPLNSRISLVGQDGVHGYDKGQEQESDLPPAAAGA